MDYNDYQDKIIIDGAEYALLTNTAALKEIAVKFGGLEEAGAELFQSDVVKALDTTLWLLELLLNQAIKLHNYKNPNDKKPLMTAEYLELATNFPDLSSYQQAVVSSMQKGMKKSVESNPGEPADPTKAA
jgi:hypothetical protein